MTNRHRLLTNCHIDLSSFGTIFDDMTNRHLYDKVTLSKFGPYRVFIAKSGKMPTLK